MVTHLINNWAQCCLTSLIGDQRPSFSPLCCYYDSNMQMCLCGEATRCFSVFETVHGLENIWSMDTYSLYDVIPGKYLIRYDEHQNVVAEICSKIKDFLGLLSCGLCNVNNCKDVKSKKWGNYNWKGQLLPKEERYTKQDGKCWAIIEFLLWLFLTKFKLHIYANYNNSFQEFCLKCNTPFIIRLILMNFTWRILGVT